MYWLIAQSLSYLDHHVHLQLGILFCKEPSLAEQSKCQSCMHQIHLEVLVQETYGLHMNLEIGIK